MRAARQCFEGPWGKLSAAERGRLLMRLSLKVSECVDELAAIEQRDCGKPTKQASATASAPATSCTARRYPTRTATRC